MSILHSFRNKETGNKTDLWIFDSKFEVEFHNHESSYFNVTEEISQEEFHEMLKKMMNSDKWEAQE